MITVPFTAPEHTGAIRESARERGARPWGLATLTVLVDAHPDGVRAATHTDKWIVTDDSVVDEKHEIGFTQMGVVLAFWQRRKSADVFLQSLRLLELQVELQFDGEAWVPVQF